MDTNWHTLLIPIDATGTKVYVDGVLAGSTATTMVFGGTLASAYIANGSASTNGSRAIHRHGKHQSIGRLDREGVTCTAIDNRNSRGQ